MPEFIATVQTFNTATNQQIETLHWVILTLSLNGAEALAQTQAENTNRTIPAIRNNVVYVKQFSRDICIFLARGGNCQGHPVEVPLKQERGGNEGEQ